MGYLSPLSPGKDSTRHQKSTFGIAAVIAIAFTAVILLAGITTWQASAQSQDALQPQSQNVEGTVNPGFVTAWQDDGDSNKVYNILARGFNSDGSQRFVDFRVNPDVSGQQSRPDVAMGAFGDFVVVYEDDRDGNEFYDLFARGFDSKGKERFAEFKVNPDSSGQQRDPAVAMAPSGEFVIVYEDDRDGNDVLDIFMRGFNSDGSQRFSDRKVNSNSKGQQKNPAVAMAANGDFVVTWSDDADGNGFYEIHARAFDSEGKERLPDFTVNSDATGNQLQPAIAMASNGDFVVVWITVDGGIYARGFYGDGSERIPDFPVFKNNEPPKFIILDVPAIAMADNGTFTVTWTRIREIPVPREYDAYAAGFNSDGSVRFPRFALGKTQKGFQSYADVAMASGSDIVIVWQDDSDENGASQILGTGYDGSGQVRISQFTVNSDASGNQAFPVVAMGKQSTLLLPYVQKGIDFLN